MRWITNYINPQLDILHIDNLRLENYPSLVMTPIPPASLHVTIGRENGRLPCDQAVSLPSPAGGTDNF